MQMSITVRDCLKLPSLSLGKVIAGRKGLDSIVTTVSVLEFDDEAEEELITPNELLITALYTAKNDIDAQCRILKRSKQNGDVGLVLFYSDVIMGSISQRFIDTADMLNLPVVLLPEKDMNLKYSDVISDVMEAVLYDKKVNNYFVSSTMERLNQLPEANRTPALALRYASDYAKASFFLCDENCNIILSSFWPLNNRQDAIFIEDYFSGEKELPDKNALPAEAKILHIAFSGHRDEKLQLHAVTHNTILNSGIMSQVAEVIQLFSAVWNYNFNVSVKESVIGALFDGNTRLLGQICKNTGIKKEIYNGLKIIELTEEIPKSQYRNILKEFRSSLSTQGRHVLLDFVGQHLIMLYHKGSEIEEIFLRDESNRIFNESNRISLVTDFVSDRLFENAPTFLKQYVKAIDSARRLYPLRKTFSAAEIRYTYHILELCSSVEGEKNYYIQRLTPLLTDGEKENLETLCCYLLDANSELKAAAQLLYVHRNTVLYRLGKIRELLGVELNKMPEAYDIYVAASIYRLEAGDGVHGGSTGLH